MTSQIVIQSAAKNLSYEQGFFGSHRSPLNDESNFHLERSEESIVRAEVFRPASSPLNDESNCHSERSEESLVRAELLRLAGLPLNDEGGGDPWAQSLVEFGRWIISSVTPSGSTK